ncbi:MAG: tRNA threonylcarbamoyladenosine dehydratase [Clostridia bacterium]|nr:tRNA threonylcarbamoyladenosine dehydratase [Clostridia bacterium]
MFSRTVALIGEESLNKLKGKKVAVFGLGGVGGYAVEALARSGIENFLLIDNDTVNISNFNRQIIATNENLNKEKTLALKTRILSINKNAKVEIKNLFYLPQNSTEIDLSTCHYVIDAVDTVSAKIEIILRAKELGIPVISCMGTGGKLDPTLLTITDIYKTKNCPLSRVMRRELKKRGVEKLKVVYSLEEQTGNLIETENLIKKAPPSMIFVPASAGLLLAKEVVLDLIK